MKRRPVRAGAAIAVVGVVMAAGITLYQLSRPGFLFGITPDISVWLGASIRLIHGALPYRDFDLVQPPGFTLLATPFAALSEWIGTRNALAVLRLCTPLLAAGSVLLIAKVMAHRGRVIVACGVMAFFPAELYALRSGLLELVVDFFCRRRRASPWPPLGRRRPRSASAFSLGQALSRRRPASRNHRLSSPAAHAVLSCLPRIPRPPGTVSPRCRRGIWDTRAPSLLRARAGFLSPRCVAIRNGRGVATT